MGTLQDDLRKCLIVFGWNLQRMTKFQTKDVENTHFTCNNFFFPRKLCRLWENVEKDCRAGLVTNDKMAHVHCMLAARLLRSWVRIPPGAWIFLCCECRVLPGRGLCDELITRPEASYRLWCVVVCDLETSRICAPYIYDIRNLRVNDLTLILLTWRKWWANNASK
jgi:hypothetical protein